MIFHGASLGLFDGDRVLLIQRNRSPFLHHWTFAGGRREGDETAAECALREFTEETGLVVTDPLHVATINIGGPGETFLLAVFASASFSGELTGSDEILDHAWVDPMDLGDLLTTPELPEILAQAHAVIRASRGDAA
jgi:8-oxo-dGTP diphosphatase